MNVLTEGGNKKVETRLASHALYYVVSVDSFHVVLNECCGYNREMFCVAEK